MGRQTQKQLAQFNQLTLQNFQNKICSKIFENFKRKHSEELDISAELSRMAKATFLLTKKEESAAATLVCKTRDLGATSMLLHLWKSHVFNKDSYKLTRHLVERWSLIGTAMGQKFLFFFQV